MNSFLIPSSFIFYFYLAPTTSPSFARFSRLSTCGACVFAPRRLLHPASPYVLRGFLLFLLLAPRLFSSMCLLFVLQYATFQFDTASFLRARFCLGVRLFGCAPLSPLPLAALSPIIIMPSGVPLYHLALSWALFSTPAPPALPSFHFASLPLPPCRPSSVFPSHSRSRFAFACRPLVSPCPIGLTPSLRFRFPFPVVLARCVPPVYSFVWSVFIWCCSSMVYCFLSEGCVFALCWMVPGGGLV